MRLPRRDQIPDLRDLPRVVGEDQHPAPRLRPRSQLRPKQREPPLRRSRQVYVLDAEFPEQRVHSLTGAHRRPAGVVPAQTDEQHPAIEQAALQGPLGYRQRKCTLPDPGQPGHHHGPRPTGLQDPEQFLDQLVPAHQHLRRVGQRLHCGDRRGGEVLVQVPRDELGAAAPVGLDRHVPMRGRPLARPIGRHYAPPCPPRSGGAALPLSSRSCTTRPPRSARPFRSTFSSPAPQPL